VYEVPVALRAGESAGPVRVARARDSALLRSGADGARVRDRLQALLPFEVILTVDRGFAIRVRLLANPAQPHARGRDAFRPIPSLLHVGAGKMRYHGRTGEPLEDDLEGVPDSFQL
jgi:hypothetical protein